MSQDQQVVDAVLEPVGPMSWTEFRAAASVNAAWWAGLDGWHHERADLPDDVPIATHLWVDGGWNGRPALLRLRLDGDQVVGCAFGAGTSDDNAPGALAVQAAVGELELWGEDGRIARGTRDTYGGAASGRWAVVAVPAVAFPLSESSSWPA
jgi:hypothetical protein